MGENIWFATRIRNNYSSAQANEGDSSGFNGFPFAVTYGDIPDGSTQWIKYPIKKAIEYAWRMKTMDISGSVNISISSISNSYPFTRPNSCNLTCETQGGGEVSSQHLNATERLVALGSRVSQVQPYIHGWDDDEYNYTYAEVRTHNMNPQVRMTQDDPEHVYLVPPVQVIGEVDPVEVAGNGSYNVLFTFGRSFSPLQESESHNYSYVYESGPNPTFYDYSYRKSKTLGSFDLVFLGETIPVYVNAHLVSDLYYIPVDGPPLALDSVSIEGSVSGSATITAKEWWPYAAPDKLPNGDPHPNAGQPIYDTETGEQLLDPVSGL